MKNHNYYTTVDRDVLIANRILFPCNCAVRQSPVWNRIRPLVRAAMAEAGTNRQYLPLNGMSAEDSG